MKHNVKYNIKMKVYKNQALIDIHGKIHVENKCFTISYRYFTNYRRCRLAIYGQDRQLVVIETHVDTLEHIYNEVNIFTKKYNNSWIASKEYYNKDYVQQFAQSFLPIFKKMQYKLCQEVGL